MKQGIKIQLPRYKMSLYCEQFDKLYMDDLQTLQRRFKYKINDLRRRTIKTPSFPMEYLVRENVGKEEIRAYTTISHKHQIEREGFDFDTVVYFKNSRGLCAYINLDPFVTLGEQYTHFNNGSFKTSHRYLFTPHFFERYEMRCGWKEGYSDIRNQFFFSNMAYKNRAFNTAYCNSRPDDYKTIDVWSLCEDGLMLGQIMGNEQDFKDGKPYIIQINTFLDIDTLTKRQDKYRNLLDVIKEYFACTKKEESIESLAKRTFITGVKKI